MIYDIPGGGGGKRMNRLAQLAAMTYQTTTTTCKDKPKAEPGQVRNVGQAIGRNEPCPCGSGLKFKKCHGKPGSNRQLRKQPLVDRIRHADGAVEMKTGYASVLIDAQGRPAPGVLHD